MPSIRTYYLPPARKDRGLICVPPIDSRLDTLYCRGMTTPDARRGQPISGSQTEWSKRRLQANLSITELARRSGVARSLVGLIDQGRLVPTPDQAQAILAVLGENAA